MVIHLDAFEVHARAPLGLGGNGLENGIGNLLDRRGAAVPKARSDLFGGEPRGCGAFLGGHLTLP
jgi:hypothetical protein